MADFLGIIKDGKLKTFDINEDGSVVEGDEIPLNDGDFEIIDGNIDIGGQSYTKIRLINTNIQLRYGTRSQRPPCQQMVLSQIENVYNYVPIIIE